MERLSTIALLAGVAFFTLTGCTHTIEWDPIHYETPIASPTTGEVSLYMDDRLKTAEHSFRAFGSGIANSWVVPYGERVYQFARDYFSRGFGEYSEVASPRVSSGMLVNLKGIDYSVSGQSAHVTVHIRASDASDRQLLERSFSAVGPSGAGIVFVGGPFAQRGMIRRSTNRALHEIFMQMLGDLRNTATQLGGVGAIDRAVSTEE